MFANVLHDLRLVTFIQCCLWNGFLNLISQGQKVFEFGIFLVHLVLLTRLWSDCQNHDHLNISSRWNGIANKGLVTTLQFLFCIISKTLTSHPLIWQCWLPSKESHSNKHVYESYWWRLWKLLITYILL